MFLRNCRRVLTTFFLLLVLTYVIGFFVKNPTPVDLDPVDNPKFTQGFYFGASTSAHQVEGDNHNQWTEWEVRASNRLASAANPNSDFGAGKGHLPDWESIQPDAKKPENYISAKAVDHFHRYRVDMMLASSIGLTAFRFSLEWSRLEPAEDVFDESAFAHYREMIQQARAAGLEPFVGLWHWTEPLWFSKKGGWRSKDSPMIFSSYVRKVKEELGRDIRYWIPLNEIDVFAANSFLMGIWPPQKRNVFAYRKVIGHLVQAHKSAFDILKDGASCQVGSALSYTNYEPAPGILRPISNIIVRIADSLLNHRTRKQIAGSSDFMGLNYYMRCRIDGWRLFIADSPVPRSDMGWELYPPGILLALRAMKRYAKPVYILESGLADAKDVHRAWYIKATLGYVALALSEGVDVRGYFHWSLLDNFEWDKGFWPRFGLIAVDRNTMNRSIRSSAWTYSAIIKNTRTGETP